MKGGAVVGEVDPQAHRPILAHPATLVREQVSGMLVRVQASLPRRLVLCTVGCVVLGVGVAMLLYAYREGDANMRSVWLCTRNDAIGNVAVLLAAVGVLGTGTAWPDLLVAVGMAVLALTAGLSVLRQARRELQAKGA